MATNKLRRVIVMFWKSDSYKKSVSIGGWLALSFLAVAYSWIGLAYNVQLNTAPTQSHFVSHGMELPQPTAKVTAPDGTILSKRLMSDLVGAVEVDRSKLLWGMYPASIRGRVFSGATEIGTPLSSSGGW